jgi:excisionase family DNA binding protein
MTAAARISQAKPYSPETLAERWGCSSEKVRLMYKDGELAGFRLGKLIRIPADEVERYECQNTASPCTEENLPSPSRMEESRAEFRLARQIGDGPKLSPVNYGHG